MARKVAHVAAAETEVQRLWNRRLGHLYKKSMELLAGGMATAIEFVIMMMNRTIYCLF
jgi:hypothetical protein